MNNIIDIDNIIKRLTKLEETVANLGGSGSSGPDFPDGEYDVVAINFTDSVGYGGQYEAVKFKVTEDILAVSNALCGISTRHIYASYFGYNAEYLLSFIVFKNNKFAAMTDYYSIYSFNNKRQLTLSNRVKLELNDVITIIPCRISDSYNQDDRFSDPTDNSVVHPIYQGFAVENIGVDIDVFFYKYKNAYELGRVYTTDTSSSPSYKCIDLQTNPNSNGGKEFYGFKDTYGSDGKIDGITSFSRSSIGFNASIDNDGSCNFEIFLSDFTNPLSTVKLSDSNKVVLKHLLESAVEVINEKNLPE